MPTRKKSRYRLRLISKELQDSTWSALASSEGLTPKGGYVEWQVDDYSELGNEVFDYLGPEGALVLSWGDDPEEAFPPPGDVWGQVNQIMTDLMGDWSKAHFEIVYETDECELTIRFKALD